MLGAMARISPARPATRQKATTKFWDVMCDVHGIGGSGEFLGENDAHLSRINVFYHEALGGKSDADNLVNHLRRQKLSQRPLLKG
jgi:hypothetical protein